MEKYIGIFATMALVAFIFSINPTIIPEWLHTPLLCGFVVIAFVVVIFALRTYYKEQK